MILIPSLVNISAEIFPGPVIPCGRHSNAPEQVPDRILARTRTSFAGRRGATAPATCVPIAVPPRACMRSVTFAMCPALWARALRHTVGAVPVYSHPWRPPPPYHLSEVVNEGTP